MCTNKENTRDRDRERESETSMEMKVINLFDMVHFAL